MNEKTQLKAFLLSLFIISAMALSQVVDAALQLMPTIPGYATSAATGGYLKNTAGVGQQLFDTAARDYGTSGKANIGGKALTIPARLPISSSAASVVKNALRLNPYVLIGSAALGYLTQNGIDLQNGLWVKAAPNTNGNGYLWHNGSYSGAACSEPLKACTISEAFEARKIRITSTFPGANSFSQISPSAPCLTTSCSLGLTYKQTATGSFTNDYTNLVRAGLATSKLPATEADFNALPDPIPFLGSELPSAPYLPGGVPVDNPKYSEVPIPMGEPYKAADGSTVQPMARVTNTTTNNVVNVSTYNLTTIDSSGVPVVAPVPETTDEKQDQCEKYPDTLGCANLDIPVAEDLAKQTVPIALISPVSVGGVGSCPAPMTASFLGQNVEVAFTPLCIFADTLRPLVLAIAWLSAGLIFIGGVRNG